ncbi:hypothetical protein AMJ83_10220 [candidate division WOR_3 bacterium SM23_42]|uniref:Uncharacterized protein n=1 Tax=candidate division WOR_3 bacterium SM23_42 TaxID=1703779 RepID=A0A0S8FTA3_UNCW3|nr:MAG: hypothetical protein AMJ83_10220 [candidate division WOR_3 bacterium SM23_42]
MRVIRLLLFIGLTLSHAHAPLFENPIYLTCDGSAIDVGNYGSPYVYDWNRDNKKDLIIGQFDNGNVRLYLNNGEHYNPSFSSFSYLLAGGVPITLPFG